MSLSLTEANQDREQASCDRILPTVCAEPDCHSRHDLQLVLDESHADRADALSALPEGLLGVSS